MISGDDGVYGTHRGVAGTFPVQPLSYHWNGDSFRVNSIYVNAAWYDGTYDPDNFVEFGIVDYADGTHRQFWARQYGLGQPYAKVMGDWVTSGSGPLGHQYRLYIWQSATDGKFRFKYKDMNDPNTYWYYPTWLDPPSWEYGFALSRVEIENQCDNADASIRDLWRQASDLNWWIWGGPTGARAAYIDTQNWKRVPRVANTGDDWNSDCKTPTYVCSGLDWLGF